MRSALRNVWGCVLPCLTTHLITITCGAGSAYPFGAPEFIPVFGGVRVT